MQIIKLMFSMYSTLYWVLSTLCFLCTITLFWYLKGPLGRGWLFSMAVCWLLSCLFCIPIYAVMKRDLRRES